MKIPFHKPLLDDDDIQAVVATLKNGWITTGPQAHAFEEDFCKYTGARHAVAVNSCTAAMHLALAGLRIGKGDAVITTPYTFVATAEAIQYVGARPVFVDIQESDLNITPETVDQYIEKWQKEAGAQERLAAILPVHIAGQPCDVLGFKQLANQHGLRVVEDAAHCLEGEIFSGEPNGSSDDVSVVDIDFNGHAKVGNGVCEESAEPAQNGSTAAHRQVGQHIGSISDATCFSFYATKNITTAEGGMVTTNNAELAERMRVLALHGMSRDAWKRYTAEGSWHYQIVTQGYKYNMPDLAAALGRSQLAKVNKMYSVRERHAQLLRDVLGEVDEIILPQVTGNVRHARHLFLIRLRLEMLKITRNDFILELQKLGIQPSVHFIPLHLQPYFQETYGYQPGDFPVSEKVYNSVISLPFYPAMSEDELSYLARCVRHVAMENTKQKAAVPC